MLLKLSLIAEEIYLFGCAAVWTLKAEGKVTYGAAVFLEGK